MQRKLLKGWKLKLLKGRNYVSEKRNALFFWRSNNHYLPAMMADAVFTWMTTFSPALKVWNILIQKVWSTVDTLLLWMLWTHVVVFFAPPALGKYTVSVKNRFYRLSYTIYVQCTVDLICFSISLLTYILYSNLIFYPQCAGVGDLKYWWNAMLKSMHIQVNSLCR